MMRKKISQLIASVIVSGLFVSCWDDFTDRAYYSANITSFAFDAHDSCPDIEDFVFNINQRSDTGQIFNLDSLPFGSNVSNLYPALKLQSTNGEIFMNDSLWIDNDSIDFRTPVLFKNTSLDGLITRVYKIKVNVHQVDPDSMVNSRVMENYPVDAAKNKAFWLGDGTFASFYELAEGGLSFYKSGSTDEWSKLPVAGLTENMNIQSLCMFNSMYYAAGKSGQLYRSANGTNWEAISVGTKFVTLYGQLRKRLMNESEPSHLIGLARDTNGELRFARSTDGVNWALETSTVDPDFPVSDYALAKGVTVGGVEFFTLATGLNASGSFASKIWSTETGKNWVDLSNVSKISKPLGKRKGASLFYYDNYLVCFGGVDPNGNYHKDMYVSPDNGLGWLSAPANWAFGKMPGGIAGSTVYVEHVTDAVNDKDREFIWILGGSREDGSLSSSVWKCYLNKMLFARR